MSDHQAPSFIQYRSQFSKYINLKSFKHDRIEKKTKTEQKITKSIKYKLVPYVLMILLIFTAQIQRKT